jgi:anthranilate synthase/aminodeoxychorismate synthase-like glutamine amidotransferase
MILVLDNYDSFVYHVAHALEEAGGGPVRVVRSDAITAQEVRALGVSHLVISPGPCTPDEAGASVPLIRTLAGHLPILGVCLGHQSVGRAFGGRIVEAPRPLHGHATPIHHAGDALFRGLPQPFEAGRYHSLAVDPTGLPSHLEVTAWDAEGTIMALRHREWPIWGVQFHPESILTPLGPRIIRNFLEVS